MASGLAVIGVVTGLGGVGAVLACGGEPVTEAGEPVTEAGEPEMEESAEAPSGESELLLSADAKLDTVRALQDDLAAPRSPADGAGRAWWRQEPDSDGDRPRVRAGERARFALVFEAGPLGVAEGGTVFLQTSPFWGWDTPQVVAPESPGYTDVSTSAEGVDLVSTTLAENLLGIEIQGRALAPGERIDIVFGAGPALARVDQYAEREERIWIAVDGDGDGVRAVLADSPTLDVLAREPAWLILTLPTTARPGDRVRLTVAALDYYGSSGFPVAGEVELQPIDGLELPPTVTFRPEDRGRLTVTGTARAEGAFRLRATGTGGLAGLEGESNPLVVSETVERVLWADLHGHSQLSDGTGTPEDFYTYARDVSALDVAALTDHDHWGVRFLDANPDMWERIKAAAAAAHEPGRFVALLAFEWTSWLHGHRHVIYFTDDGEVVSSIDPETETPRQLWDALEGKEALTFAHHSAGGPISTNWLYPPDPVLEPVTEIVSVHGSSEAPDSPRLIYNPVYGNFVRDALDHGYRFGFIGSGDSHDGHPGLAQIASPPRNSGLAAIIAEEATRPAVLDALRKRRVYATTGPRIWLDVSLDGHPMGSTLTAGDDPPPTQELRVEVEAVSAIERVDFIRSGLVARTSGEGRVGLTLEREIPRLAPGEYVYVRVVQEDDGAAWSSPIFAE